MRRTALTLALLSPLAGPSHAWAVDCYAASSAIADQSWTTAEAMLRALLLDAACAPVALDLQYSLAYVLEQQAPANPRSSCEARDRYRQVAERSSDPAVRQDAEQGALRVGAACAAIEQPAAPTIDAPPPAPAPTATPSAPEVADAAPTDAWPPATRWFLGAGAAVSIGGTLLGLSLLAADSRDDAGDAYIAAHLAGDDTRRDAEGRAFDDAASRASWLNIAGWTAVGVGAGLGAVALWHTLTGDEPGVAIGPDGLWVHGRF